MLGDEAEPGHPATGTSAASPRLPLAHPVLCRLRFSNKINLNSLFQVSRSFKSGFPVHGPATGFPNRQISLAPQLAAFINLHVL